MSTLPRLLAGFAILTLAGAAAADCTNNRVEDLSTLLEGNTVCANSTSNSDQWQEYHQAGGTLFEYALGPGHPVDPSREAGSWSVANNNSLNATVTYNYGTGGSFVRAYYGTGPSYSICDASSEVATATISGGQVSCGF